MSQNLDRPEVTTRPRSDVSSGMTHFAEGLYTKENGAQFLESLRTSAPPLSAHFASADDFRLVDSKSASPEITKPVVPAPKPADDGQPPEAPQGDKPQGTPAPPTDKPSSLQFGRW